MTKGDIGIEEIDTEVCDDCHEPSTHRVSVCLNEIGSTIYEGAYCKLHAETRAEAIRAGLPEDEP